MSASFPRSPPQSRPSPPPSFSSSSLTRSEFQTFRRILCSDQKIVVAFADYPTRPAQPQLVVSEKLSLQSCRWAGLDESDDIFRHPELLSSCLRYGRFIASFNLYPESQRDVAINRLLWRTVQRGEYSPSEGNMLLQTNVLSVSMPHPFYSFLADVTEEQLKLCMLEILTLIAEEEDEQGFGLMQSELEDSVWNDLMSYISQKTQRESSLEQLTTGGVMLSTYVEMLIKLCYDSPWKVDVHTAYITPRAMMSALLAASRKSAKKFRTLSDFDSDRKLVRSAGKRPISSSAFQLSSSSRRTNPFANRNSVFWKLFQDWQRYRWMLVHLLGIHPHEAAAAMLRSIGQGTQEKAWQQVEAVIRAMQRCSFPHSKNSLIACLPEEVVSTKIAPFVLLKESNR